MLEKSEEEASRACEVARFWAQRAFFCGRNVNLSMSVDQKLQEEERTVAVRGEVTAGWISSGRNAATKPTS